MSDALDRPKRDIGKLRIAIARHLRDIENLALDLHAQALNDANARDFPGGTALHMLGPAASLAEWEAQYEATETNERWTVDGTDRWASQPKLDPALDQGDDNEQPLNVLESWTRIIREERNQPTGLKANISREIDYLRKSLDWACEIDIYGDPAWPACIELANELRALVHAMENTLRAGDRIDTDAAPCFQIDAGGERCGGTLARVNLKPRQCAHAAAVAEMVDHPSHISQAMAWLLSYYPHVRDEHRQCDQGGRDDLYRCLSCEKVYTPTEYWLAVSDNEERKVAG